MATDKVIFDKKGSYSFSTPKDMDVDGKRAAAKKPAAPRKKAATPTAKKPSVPKAAPKKAPAAPKAGFNLDSLKSRAGMQVQEPEAIEEKTPVVEPAPEVVPEPVPEAVSEPMSEPIKEEPVVETKEVKAEEPTPEVPEESPVVEEKPVTPEFGLGQVGGVTSATKPVEGSAVAPTPKAMNLGEVKNTEVRVEAPPRAEPPKEMNLGRVEPSTPDVTPEPPKVEAKPEAKPEAPKPAGAPIQFDIVPPEQLLSIPYGGTSVNDIPDEVSKWVYKTIKESCRHGAAIIESAAHPELRIYSVFHAGRSTDMCVALGVDTKLAVFTVNSQTQQYVDMSASVSLSGTCAMVEGKPVASTSQRKSKAIAL